MRKLMTILTLCATLAAGGCHKSQPAGSLLPDSLRLSAGDVVFRRCTGLVSRLVTWSDERPDFSHTGIVVDSAGVAMIVYAVPGEPDFPGDPDRVKMETPELFFSSAHAVAAAVLRPRDGKAGCRAAQVAMEKYRDGVLFDHSFDDSDTTQLYCTELITHAYHRAGVELVDSQRHVVDLPGMHYRCIMPSQLTQSPFLQTIFMFHP